MPLPARLLAAGPPPAARPSCSSRSPRSPRPSPAPRPRPPGDPLASAAPPTAPSSRPGPPGAPGPQGRGRHRPRAAGLRSAEPSTPACGSAPRSPRRRAPRTRTTRRCSASPPARGTRRPGRTSGRSSAPGPTARAPRPRRGSSSSRRRPLAARPRGPVDRAHPGPVGSSNGASFVIRTGGIPAGVDRARFLALVRNAGRRWRLHSLGTIPGRPRLRQRPLRGRLLDRPGPAPGAGGHHLRPAARRRDTRARPDPPRRSALGAGAGSPVAGARRPPDRPPARVRSCRGQPFHVPRGCRDTPMVVGLATGEWWRSTTDFSYRACNRAG